MLVEPRCRLWERRYFRELGRRLSGKEVSQQSRLLKARRPVIPNLNREQPLVNDMSQSVNDPGTVEINPSGRLMLE
jgi:hypothetical protein